ncbi:MAG: polymer-forming cytoskeletal protein [Candidatus Thermoplasmatota archaeon]|nr:polymer-forming cytoskeletal protein [Candidatus Thermoplasmatota archaeon]
MSQDMVFDRSLCHIPEGTVIEEKNIRCKGDVIFSDRSQLKRGIMTEGRVFLGEFMDIEGDIISIGDIRIDKGSRIQGNITGDADIYIGERSIVAGEIIVGNNLDIGEGVDVDPNAIDSKGRINIRNPISVIVYLLLYLLELLRRNDSQEVDNFFKEIEEGGGGNILVGQNFIYFPKGSRVGSHAIKVPGDMRVGHGCQIAADLKLSGGLDLESEVQIFGDIEAEGEIILGENTVINGNIRTEGDVLIHHAARITGNIRGRNITTTPDTIIDGTLKGEEGIRILPEGGSAIEERISRFEKGMDHLDGIM